MAKTKSAPADRTEKVADPERVAAFRTGISAESRAAAVLMATGSRILAECFRTPHDDADFELRFDVILIAPRHLPRHLLAAFDASS